MKTFSLPENTLQTWGSAWHAIGAHGDGQAVRDRLMARYAEPHRHYHSLQHLAEVLSGFLRYGHLAERPAEVALALWFHDAIYAPPRHDNEDASAAWALQALLAAGVDAAIAQRVKSLVLITQHTALPETGDERLLVDLDLSILAASPARFAQYEMQIRREYGFVPDATFTTKRRDVLRSFLDRATVFSTPVLQQQLEGDAQRNLRQAVERLSAHPWAG